MIVPRHLNISEIPGFLTDGECEGIINRTKKQGLFTSHVHIDPESREYEKKLKGLIGMLLFSYCLIYFVSDWVYMR